MVGKRRSRSFLVACVLAILVAGISFPVPALSSPEVSRKVPVVLASEYPGGREYWVKAGVIDLLLQNGWREGENLWVFEPHGTFGDLSQVSGEFASFLREAVQSSGVHEIDVVAPGVAGLYARYCVESGMLEPLKVRTLVSAGTPHGGAFFAGLLKSAVAMVRYERHVTGEMGPLDLLGGRPPAIEKLDMEKVLSATPWESETQIVLERARCYEPLYHEYLLERHFAVPGLPLESSRETFPGWLSRRYPQVWEAKISDTSDPGTGLTLAYYELLSMEASKNGYAMKIVPRQDFLQSVVLDGYRPSTWQDALVHYGTKLLTFVMRNAAILGKGMVEEEILSWVAGRVAFLSGPDDPFIDRLVTENVLVNMGSSSSRRFFGVPANVYLTRWNETSFSCRNGTRYVSLIGRRPDVLRAVWPQLGPGDWFVEVDAAVAPQRAVDVVMVFDRLPLAPGLGVLGSREAKDALLKTLSDPFQSWLKAGVGEDRFARVRISSWRPTLLTVATDREGAVAFEEYVVTVTPANLPRGWSVVAAFSDGSPVAPAYEGGSQREQGSARTGVAGGQSLQDESQDSVAFRTRVFSDDHGEVPGIILKLVPSARQREGPVSQVPDLYSQEVTVTALVEVERVPAGNTEDFVRQVETGEASSPEGVQPAGTGESPGDEIASVPPTAVTEEALPGGGEDAGWQDPAGVDAWGPLIVVTYRSKKTSHMMPVEDYPVPATLRLEGPKKWVTGKPARFEAFFDARVPPDVLLEDVRFDPAPRFSVVWRRSGEFRVSVAVRATFRVVAEGKERRVVNVYVTEVPVSVLTPGITD